MGGKEGKNQHAAIMVSSRKHSFRHMYVILLCPLLQQQCPPAGDLPNPGIEPVSLTSPTLAGGFLITHATWEAPLWSVRWICLFQNGKQPLLPTSIYSTGQVVHLSPGMSCLCYCSTSVSLVALCVGAFVLLSLLH